MFKEFINQLICVVKDNTDIKAGAVGAGAGTAAGIVVDNVRMDIFWQAVTHATQLGGLVLTLISIVLALWNLKAKFYQGGPVRKPKGRKALQAFEPDGSEVVEE